MATAASASSQKNKIIILAVVFALLILFTIIIVVIMSRQKKPTLTPLNAGGNWIIISDDGANGSTAIISDSGGGNLTITLPEPSNIPPLLMTVPTRLTSNLIANYYGTAGSYTFTTTTGKTATLTGSSADAKKSINYDLKRP